MATEAAPATATSTPSPQPAAPLVLITAPLVNLRDGPGTAYPVTGQAQAGTRLPIRGRTVAGDWWQIEMDGDLGWVYAPLVESEGDLSGVPVLRQVPTPPAPSVRVYETTLSIPTYPYLAFTEEAYNAEFDWTFRRLDRLRYEASNPQPAPKAYTLIVLENEYLRLTLLPELGGRVYQVIFKPTGNNEFYQNPVIKPSPWGPPEQDGWLAAGGMEWDLPVEEHGYAWGDPWGHIILPFNQSYAGVTVFMPDQGHLRAEVDITLRAGEAVFTVQPRIVNPSSRALNYQFWLSAALAPGPANSPGPGMRFLFPTDQMTMHSRGDESLPLPQQPFTWPIYQGRDLGRLGNWNQWLGFFERPAAHGPFAGAYDRDADEGIVRVFPPAATPGSKGFGLGWASPLNPDLYADDGSAYVELHGGITPTFWDQASLAAGGIYSWQESWYPVAGIGGVSHADGNGAAHLAITGDSVELGLFTVRPQSGRLRVTAGSRTIVEEPVNVGPDQPFSRILPNMGLPTDARLALTLFDTAGEVVLHFE